MRVRTTTFRRMSSLAPIVATGASSVMVLGMFLGWFRSGERMRNSFEMFRIPQQLGLEGFTGVRVLWFLVPVMAVGVVGLLGLSRPLLAALLLGVKASIVMGVSLIVLASDLQTGFGPVLAALGAAVGFVAVAMLAIFREA